MNKEVTAAKYGEMIFDICTKDKTNLADHWKAIYDEAKPLVEALIALNDRTGAYKIHGHKKGNKRVLSNRQKIEKAQEELLVKAGTLKEGDRFWTNNKNYDREMYIGQDDPVVVSEVTKKAVYFEESHCGGHHTSSVGLESMVYKAPEFYAEYSAFCNRLHSGGLLEESIDEFNKAQEEFYKKEQEFSSDEYWLERYKAQYGE